MVAFQGSKRIIASVYGITSYNDLAGVPLTLNTFSITSQLDKVNINNLGVKSINNTSDIDFTKFRNYKPITIIYSSELDSFIVKDYAVNVIQTSEFYSVDGNKIKQLTDYAYNQYESDPTALSITINQIDLFNIITKEEIDELYDNIKNNLNIKLVSNNNSSGTNSVKTEFPISQYWYEDESNDIYSCSLELYQVHVGTPRTRNTIKQVYYNITFNISVNSDYSCYISVFPLATADDIANMSL